MRKKNKLFAVALMTGAIAAGTWSCSNDDDASDVAVTGITVSPESRTLLPGDTAWLTATTFPAKADQSVTWASDNTAVATVANGVVTAVAAGTANITVTSVANTAKTATCVITVNTGSDVLLSANSLLMLPDSTWLLVATIDPPDASKSVSWSSSNTAAATVSSDGVVTAVAPGTATITAALAGSSATKAECTVAVVDMSSIPAGESLVGWWAFEDKANSLKATKGENLIASDEYTVLSDGPNGTKGVAANEDTYFTITHNIGANGDGEYTNEYTLMMDIRGSQDGFDGWLSVYMASDDGGGKLWIDGDGKIGFAALGGYSETGLTVDTWRRVVIAVNLAEGSYKVYSDGVLIFTATENVDADGEFSLYPDAVYIGYDGDGYPGPDFAEVRMWSVQLTNEQVTALGAAGTP
jgi:hypothetical protein